MGLDVGIYSAEETTSKYCPCCENTYQDEPEMLYNANITHNLSEMAGEADLYNALWRPYRLHPNYKKDGDVFDEEWSEGTLLIMAEKISGKVEEGLAKLKSNPSYFKKFNAPNGWGTYKDFVSFVENYLNALKKYPDGIVEVNR